MFTMSPRRRLISAGLPAPSITTMSNRLRKASSEEVTAPHSRRFRSGKSIERSEPFISPISTSWEDMSPSGFSRTGFISTVGDVMAASAWTAWARPISNPSGVTAELSDMFCALKGATLNPSRANMRQSPAAMKLLPTDEPVPCAITTRALISPPAVVIDFLPKTA